MFNEDRRIVRVFVSSTFRDMHAERDYLNRFVFPELRNRCHIRGVEFVSVDLRWGITPEEATKRGTLKICLEEMVRCKPFFVCLMGERYGWIPAPEEVSQILFETVLRSGGLTPKDRLLLKDFYKLDTTAIPPVYCLDSKDNEINGTVNEALVRLWELHDAGGTLMAGYSITAREVLKAVFDEQYRMSRAYFYLRSQGGAGIHDHPHFPSSFIQSFLEIKERNLAKLKLLKGQIREKADELIVREYEAEFAGIQLDPVLLPPALSDEDRAALQDGLVRPEEWSSLSGELRAALLERGTVALNGMEELGAQVLDDLWAGIEAEIETTHGTGTIRGTQSHLPGHHERFILNKTRIFVGRRELMDLMLRYVRGVDGSSSLVVTGAAGVGKSALLSKFTEECRSQLPASVVLPYFIGGAPGSEQLAAMLGGLCKSLRSAGGLDFELPTDADDLRRLFPSLLREVAKQKQVVLILDALNQLDPAGHSHEMLWFPFTLPPGVRLVVSTQEGECFNRLASRVAPDHIVVVPELPAEDRRRLISETLSLRGKMLSGDLIDELLDLRLRPDAGLPLYLLVALEELCLFGSYEALGRRISLLAPRLSELFQQVLARLEQDYDGELVRPVFRWLAVSRSGLLEPEIIDLLRAYKPRFQMAHWLRLYRAMQFYLRPMEENEGHSNEGRIAFFYEQLRLSIFERYFHMGSFSEAPSEDYRHAHSELADYFISAGRGHGHASRWRSDHPRALGESPHHLTHSGRWPELAETLMDLSFLEAKAEAGMAFDLAANLSEAAELPINGSACEHLSALASALRDDISFIVRHPETIFQCLWNRCWWHDSPEAGRYFEQADDGANSGGLPGPKLFGRLKSWRADKERSTPGFRWVRALRPLSPSSIEDRHLILRGHSHSVFAVAFSPDGRLIASGSKDTTVRVWDAATGEERACLVGHRNMVQSLAFSSDGTYVISGSGNPDLKAPDGTLIGETDYTVRVWNVSDGTEVFRFEGHQGLVRCVAVSPDGECIASGDSNGVVRLWSVRDGADLGSFNLQGEPVSKLRFSRDGMLFSASFDGTVCVWEAETRRELSRFRFGELSLMGMSVSPDGSRVALAESPRIIAVCDWRSGQEILRLTTSGAFDVAWSADGRYIIGGGGGGTVHVWEADTGKEVAGYRGHEGTVTSVAASPDGHLFASGSMDGSVRVWSLSAGGSQRKVRGHEAPILCLRYSPDGQYFATGSEDNAVCLWDAADGSLITRLEGHTQPVICVAFLEGGRQLASGSYDGTLCFWQTETACQIAVTTLCKSLMPNSVAVSTDGRTFAYTDVDGYITVIDAPSRRESLRLRGEGEGSILTISQDGNRLAAAGMFGTVEVWDLKTGAKLALLKEAGNGITCVAFSPTGKRLACGSLGAVKVWDWGSQAVLDLEGHGHLVSGVAFSLDGLFVVSEAEDGTARIWSAASGLCIGVVYGGVDARAIAGGYPWTVSIHDSYETSFASVADGCVVGWFPAMPGMLTTLNDRRTWVGVARTGHLYTFRMEGEERQPVSIREQVPLMSLGWGAAARDALREGEVARARSLLDHMESVCREFEDPQGLLECESLRAVIKQSEVDVGRYENDLTRAAQKCVQFFVNREYREAVQEAMDLAEKMYLDHTLLQVLFISIQRVTLAVRQAPKDWIREFAPGYMKPIKDPWHIQLLMTTLGQKEDMHQLLGLARTREQFCQGCYYVGARLMIDGYLEEAMKAFEMSLGSNADCVEYLFAQVDSQTVRSVLSRQ